LILTVFGFSTMFLIVAILLFISVIPLFFSKDTVYLDTVFTNIGSSTYTLKVYNRADKAVQIPVIHLENGEDSGYRLNVDGIPGKSFENVEIPARDSIYVFIETTIDYNQVTDPLYVDRILFDTGENEQSVHLVTLVQDAHFLYPGRENGVVQTIQLEGFDQPIIGRYLTDDELVFTDEKPYVIYGHMIVGDENNNAKTLVMQPGTRVHFHANSGLIVEANSSLQILGEQSQQGQPPQDVVLEGDRLEPEFSDTPSQWNYIYLRNGSQGHIIRNAVIKNAIAGIVVEGLTGVQTPTLQLYNTQIYNMGTFGVLGYFTNIKGENVVIGNTGRSSFAGILGGVYEFTHCTFANYWTFGRENPTLLLTNNTRNPETNQVQYAADLVKADFINCIIYGSKNVEWGLDNAGEADFEFRFDSCFMKFYDPNGDYDNALYNLNDSDRYFQVITTGIPDFQSTTSNDYLIGENSACNGNASPEGTAAVPLDILGVTRGNPADIGAYEHAVFEEGGE